MQHPQINPGSAPPSEFRICKTSWLKNSKTFRIKKVNFSGYYFFMKTNIKGDSQICISVSFCAELYVAYLLSIIFCYYINKPLLFQKHFCLFLQKITFSTCFASTTVVQGALLGVQIIVDICVLAKTSLTSSVVFLKLFLLVKCFHMNLTYWRQNTSDVVITSWLASLTGSTC